MAHYTLRTDDGATPVIGTELLRIRIAEVAALRQLRSVGGTQRFIAAAAEAAKRPIESAKNIISHPIDTAKGIPDGVGRFFGRVKRGAQKMGDGIRRESAEGEYDGTVAKQAGAATADALGYEQERRLLAKQIGVDPYTTNPALAKELDHVAWVSFSGRLGMNVLFSAVVPGSMIISATNFTNNLVWDTPRADLVIANEAKLRATGARADVVTVLQANPAWSLSLRTALVQALGRLSGASGLPDVVALAAEAGEEPRARFIAGTAEMLAGYHAAVAPITAVTAEGTLVARDRDGTVVVPAAVDYVAWTPRVRDFAHRPDLAGPRRALWIRGDLSPRARESLKALGWDVHERWTPPAAR
jgi:hypothetical protein